MSPYHQIIILVVAFVIFMEALDATIINTAIPAMAHSLGVHPVDLKVALISYLLVLAIFIPASGWLSDKFGPKRIFMFAIAVFTVSSLWCGLANSLMELVVARSIQGLGGALMSPTGRLIILRNFPRHQVVEVMNIVVMVVSFGLMLGPFAGGLITDYLSWHWIFWVNIPFGVATFLIVYFLVKPVPPRSIHRFDFMGFVLFGLGVAGITFSFSYLSESDGDLQFAYYLMGLSALLLLSYFMYARQKHEKLINIKLFWIRTFRISIFSNFLSRMGVSGIPFLLPLLFQVCLGYSAKLSGLLLVPVAFGIFVIKFKSLSTRLLRYFGYRTLLIINSILITLSIWSLQLIQLQMSPYLIAILTFIFGLLISLQYTGMNSLGYADIPDEQLSDATSIVSTMQQLAQSFGVAVAALSLNYFSSDPSHHIVLRIPIFHHTFGVLGLISLLTIFVFLSLQPKDGHQMITEDKINNG